MVQTIPQERRLRAKEANVRALRINRLRSLVNYAVLSFALIATSLCAATEARGQQAVDDEGKPEETAASEPQKKPEPKKKPSIFDHLKITFDIAALSRQIEGDRPGKFQEYRDYPQGFSMRNFRLNFESAASPWLLNFRAQEIRERDQGYSGEFGKIGKYRTRVSWDQTPRYYSFGKSFFVQTAPGSLSVSQSLRAALQAAIPETAPGATAFAASPQGPALTALLNQELQTAPTIQLRVRWDQFLITQSYRPTKNWEFYVRAQHLRLNGTRPRPTGTFARENNFPTTAVPTQNDGVWESLGSELPEPVSYRTTNLTFGFQYSRPKWRFGVDYFISLFRNEIESLTWENPFRVTDNVVITCSPGVSCSPLISPPTASNARGRNRFVHAQLALAPDNDYQSLSVHGSVDLPHDTQLRGEFSWGRGTQNRPFLPYTLNTALTNANLVANGAPPNVPTIFGTPLPQPSLNGVVRTLNGDAALTSRPWHNMQFLLQYRADDMQNQSPIIRFPALPNFGDGTLRATFLGQPQTSSGDYYGLPFENYPTSYTKHNITANWQWDPRKNLGLEFEYDWEIWNRKFRDAPRTNEHSVQGRLSYKPEFIRGVTFKGDYLYSHRIPTAYLTQPFTFNPNLGAGLASGGGPGWEVTLSTVLIPGIPLEFNMLRRFDEDNRIRKDGGVSIEVARSEKLNYSISYRYLRDDYDKSFWGLHYGTQSTVDAQVNYFARENTFFYANYSREFDQTGYRGMGHLIIGAIPNVRACCAQYPVANSWDRASRINLDMFQVGFNTSSAGERTVFDFSYGFGFAKDRTNTVNPFPILANSPRTAGVLPYPDVINRQQEVNLSLTHRLREGLDVGLSYRFEPYRLNDYYTDGLQPYSAKQLADGSFGANTPRQLFLDARFTTMHANVATVFLRYSF